MILGLRKYNDKGRIYYMSTTDQVRGCNYITRKEYDILKKGCIQALDLTDFECPTLVEHYYSFEQFKGYCILTSQKAYKQACKDRDSFAKILNKTKNQENQIFLLNSLIKLFEKTSERYF